MELRSRILVVEDEPDIRRHAQDMHYVRVHMANLRKKVEDVPPMPKHLLTEAGIGYRFRP